MLYVHYNSVQKSFSKMYSLLSCVLIRLRFANIFPRLPSHTKKISDVYLLCLTIKLHNHSAIYFSILFIFKKFPPLLSECIYLFIALYIAVYMCIMYMCYLVL